MKMTVSLSSREFVELVKVCKAINKDSVPAFIPAENSTNDGFISSHYKLDHAGNCELTVSCNRDIFSDMCDVTIDIVKFTMKVFEMFDGFAESIGNKMKRITHKRDMYKEQKICADRIQSAFRKRRLFF